MGFRGLIRLVWEQTEWCLVFRLHNVRSEGHREQEGDPSPPPCEVCRRCCVVAGSIPARLPPKRHWSCSEMVWIPLQ